MIFNKFKLLSDIGINIHGFKNWTRKRIDKKVGTKLMYSILGAVS